jgi:hypothetical protein
MTFDIIQREAVEAGRHQMDDPQAGEFFNGRVIEEPQANDRLELSGCSTGTRSSAWTVSERPMLSSFL